MIEIWKEIPGFNNIYEVSNFGRVRNNKSGMIKSFSRLPKGYCVVTLGHHTNQYVHRLVAKAFLPIIPDKNEVNHKDGNKEHNFSSNLEWVSHSENQHHAYRILQTLKLNLPHGKGEKNSMAKLTTGFVEEIRSLYLSGITQRKIAEKFGIAQSHVSSICSKRLWKD